MNLGNIFKRDNQNVRTADVVKAAEAVTKGERSYRLQSEIRSLVPGQTIQGEVVGRNGSAIQLALANELLVNARLDQNITIALGQQMSFEILSNNGSTLSLSPLYANMANEATILRALAAAGLPETVENMEMVAKMMEEGMPIDKNSLLSMSRNLLEFPEQNQDIIIQMARLELPITEENIEQFTNYRNATHQLLGGMETVMEEIPQVFEELMAQGHADTAFTFYEAVLDIFTEESGETVLLGEDGQVSVTPLPAQETAGTDQPALSRMPEEASRPVTENFQEENTKTVLPENPEAVKDSEGGEQKAQAQVRFWGRLGDMLKELGADEKTVSMTKEGELSPKDILKLVKGFIPKEAAVRTDTEVLARVLGCREFHELLKSEMEKQWLLEPKNVAEAEKVEELYERVRQQTARLNETLQDAGKADVPLAKSVQNIQSNVDFINQMNHMFTYIQLPLKLTGNNAHGDLYVYTNKKNLAAKDGNVSALLHLDMEHLGPLDVYVAMQQSKVSTNFTLQDESALELIAEHIDLLNERLSKRGYDLKAQFQLKEEAAAEENGIMDAILNQDKNISVLSRTSFDMRA